MTSGHEMLLAIFDPSRPSHLAGEKRDDQLLRIDMSFDAEASADVERHTADLRFGKLENG